METKYGYFRTEKHVDIAARNIAPYNNSFESLVKDLKNIKRTATGCCFCPVPVPEPDVWRRICGTQRMPD